MPNPPIEKSAFICADSWFKLPSMENKSRIAVCFALAEEAGAFKKLRGDATPVFFTGIGRANAEKAVRQFLAANSPELLLTCGFAGGLRPEWKIGDVLFEIREDRGNDDFAVLRAKLTEAGAKPAKIFCADRIAVTAAEKKKLREQTSADAAEMESGAIHAVCQQNGVPCATVRVISDTADEDLPFDFNNYLKEDKSVDMSKLMMAVAKAPWKMGALMALQKNTKLAAEKLAEVLGKIVA